LRLTIAAGLLSGFLLSPQLWVSTRFYPLTPAAPFLKSLPFPFDYLAYLLLLSLVTAAGVAPRPRVWIYASAVLLCALWMQDQSRQQPWCYQYAFMLAALTLPKTQRSLNVCRLIVATIYFWSGAQKLNPYFASGTFTWLAHPVAVHFPALVVATGYAAPWIEMGCGVALLTRRFRRPAAVALIVMHALILLAIGPFGRGSNMVVWPWNFAMIAFLLLLFRDSETRTGEILWGPGGFDRAVFALFALAPALCFVSLWDSYLSAALYSGNKNQGAIYMTDAVAEHLPDAVYGDVTEETDGMDKLLINDWSFDELNVPAYPEVRVYKRVARKLCEFAAAPGDVKLEVQGKWMLWKQPKVVVYSCAELR
jgi:uncharacterized membrane protein YphA (DoxX/SURF4 family)